MEAVAPITEGEVEGVSSLSPTTQVVFTAWSLLTEVPPPPTMPALQGSSSSRLAKASRCTERCVVKRGTNAVRLAV